MPCATNFSHLMVIFIVIIPGLEITSTHLQPIEPGVTGLILISVQKFGID